MKGASDNWAPAGMTPEYVMDLGRRAWFEAIMNSLPKEELFKIRRATDIKQEGRQEGEVKMLVRLLMRRFGELPAAIYEKIVMADLPDLEAWGDLVLDARSLEDVFGPD
ncbi:MAG: DUF4351 domain-containing protein [Magnetococcus sp. YQC-5]